VNPEHNPNWTQRRNSNSKHTKNSPNLKKPRSEPTPTLHAASLEGTKQRLGAEGFPAPFCRQPRLPFTEKRRAVPCLSEMDLGGAMGAIPLLPLELAAVSLGRVSACCGTSVLQMPAEPGFRRDRGSITAGAAPVRRCKAILLPWVLASAQSSAPCPQASGGTDPAPALVRWLQIRVNHLPAECCQGVSEFLAPTDTRPCTRLSCSCPKLLHQVFCNKKPQTT